MKEILEGRNCNNNETGENLRKKIIGAAAAVILCAIVLVLIFGHVTGDDLLFKNKKNLVVQSYVTMDESNINALTGGQIKMSWWRRGPGDQRPGAGPSGQ